MADFTVNRPGQKQGGADDPRELFLRKFSGEVLQSYLKAIVVAPLVRNRSISGGKSATFPIIGLSSAARHAAGAEMLGNAISHSEREIFVDAPLVSHVSIYKFDELMNHFDIRADYARKLGQAIAEVDDKLRIRSLLLAARASATLTDYSGGSQISTAAMDTDPDVLLDGVASAAQKLDEKNIPKGDRSCLLKPAQWYLLTKDGRAFHRDYGNDGNGSQASGMIGQWQGIRFFTTNNYPTDNYAGVTGEVNSYVVDATKSVAVVFNRQAVGTVTLAGMNVESEYSVRHQATILVASMANGTGILEPQCSVELIKP
jgi:hypothetical protein